MLSHIVLSSPRGEGRETGKKPGALAKRTPGLL